MKPVGAVSDYSHERLEDIMKAYDAYVASCSHINISELFSAIVSMPAPRFYVSENRAAVVIAAMLRGDKMPRMRPSKRRMFDEIMRRFLILRQQRPQASVVELVSEVILQPAPEFYLSPYSAKAYHYKIKRLWIQRKLRRLGRLR